MIRPALVVLFALSLPACGDPPGVITPQRVQALELELPDGGTWICDRFAGGYGGQVTAALGFALWLHQHDVGVAIPPGEVCASAAALAALAAPRFAKAPSGHLIFHGPSIAFSPVARAIWRALFVRWRVPPAIAERILALPPGEFWEPKGADLEALLASRLP